MRKAKISICQIKKEVTIQLENRETEAFGKEAWLVGRAIVLAIALLLLVRNITEPFTGPDWNDAQFGIFARNHVQYGLGYTKLFYTWGDTFRNWPGVTPPIPEQQRYLNHPPLLALFAAIPMYFFGDHEWVCRVVPILTTLGSAWLLMLILSRLQSPLFGLVAGFFYVTLPAVAYFGRMLDHESPVQFFSLLMLHGYLQWAKVYGSDSPRKRGIIYYTVGVVLGIGTGWAAIIMPGLIWLWHICYSLRNPSTRRLLLWLAVIPAISLTAVLVHIMWGCNWDASLFKPLFISRTIAPQEPITWTKWGHDNWLYLRSNFSNIGIAAAVLYPVIILVIVMFTGPNSPFRQILPGKSILPVSLITLHGIIWVIVFKHQSWVHPYWQYFIAPFFAFVLASVSLTAVTFFRKTAPPAAALLTIIILVAPMAFFAKALDQYRMYQNEELTAIVSVFKTVSQFVPPRVPVMTSEKYELDSESFGNYKTYWINPQIFYYANRPFVYSTDINDIEANRQGCAAYVLRLTNDPNTEMLAQKLYAKYNKYGQPIQSAPNYLIFFLKEMN